MARTSYDGKISDLADQKDHLTFQAHGEDKINLPSSEFISDAHMTRDGDDLVLETPTGEVAVIEGYFAVDPAPLLQSPEGAVLTPNLVNSFVQSSQEYAANDSASDESPIGSIEEVKGEVTITRADGTVIHNATIGTPIHEGDIVETDAHGAVNIVFIDETNMAISENARMAIDEYAYDPATESGTTNFSVLRGLFVFTSGLIGRDDPDDVKIDTPVGSIGIRGTIIAGQIDPHGESNISVLEGAIVVKNGLGETTLSNQFETVKLGGFDQPMESMGVVPAADISNRFSSVSTVVPTLFTTINETVHQQSADQTQSQQPQSEAPSEQPQQQMQQQQAPEAPATEPVTQISPTVDTSIVSLNTNTSGLPSNTIISGQADTLVSSTSSTMTAPTTSIAPPPVTSAPAPTTQPIQPAPTNTQPPPTVIAAPTAPANTGFDIGNPLAFKITHITDNLFNSAGYTVTALGDIDNDGFDDFAFSNNAAVGSNNHVYIIHGSSGILPDGVLSSYPGLTTPLIPITTTTGNAKYNTVIAGIGDFDGDGKEDYIVGQEHGDVGTGTIDSGNAAIVSGNNPNDNLKFVGSSVPMYGIGTSVDGIGDFNNDGYADVIIGAPGVSGGDGAAYLVRGGANWALDLDSASPGSNAQKLTVSLGENSAFGSSVTSIGDYNGDGYSDFAVGAPLYGTNQGRISIYLGNNAGNATTPIYITGAAGDGFGKEITGVGDINGDGKSDFVFSDHTNHAYVVLGGNTTPVSKLDAGSFTIIGGGGVGDFNGDGYDDFVVSLGGTSGSKSFVVFGRDGFGGPLDLNYLKNPDNAMELNYAGANSSSGVEVNGIGDINGDGYDDFAMGVPDLNGGGSGNGGVILVYGRDNGQTINATTSNPYVNAVADHQSLVGTAGANGFSDGGYAHISMRGGAGNDMFQISNTSFLNIDGGSNFSGADVIKTMGNGNTLNFTNVDFERISGIEGLQYGGSNQTITLTMENLFNLLKTSDTGTLKISAGTFTGATLVLDDGNGTDDYATGTPSDIDTMLDAASGGNAGPDATVAGYNTFKIGGYHLLIETNITVDAQ